MSGKSDFRPSEQKIIQMSEETTNYSYKDDFREGIVFAFVRDDEILIEHRLGKRNDTFIPNGSIEMKDHVAGQDYREVALLREVAEELGDHIELKQHDYLGEVKAEEIKVIFYIYVILQWDGETPAFSMENGEKNADLEWVKLRDYKRYFIYDAAFDICKTILRYQSAT